MEQFEIIACAWAKMTTGASISGFTNNQMALHPHECVKLINWNLMVQTHELFLE